MTEQLDETRKKDLFGQIFKFSSWDYLEFLQCQFYSVSFLVDFGPWKKGDVVRCLTVDLDNAQFVEYDKDGKEVRRVYVTLTASQEKE